MRILTPEAMREVDRRAIEAIGVPGLVLMENAAIGVADAIAREFPSARAVLVLCGPGNNGGDGLAIARHLDTRGYQVETLLASKRLSGDAERQLAICRALGMTLWTEDDPEAGLGELGRRADLVVDALFGTGLSRPLEGAMAELVDRVNALEAPCVAVDLPSGLDAGRVQPIGPHVVAQLTVAFAAPKIAHVFPPAAHAVGRLVVADLGIPPRLVDEAEGDLRLLSESGVAALLRPRHAEAHKGDFGHLLIVAGSSGKSGAALLAARSAVRSGAGLVTLAVPAPLLAALDSGSTESMTLALPSSEPGVLAEEAAERALAACSGKTALAIGPGLGTASGTVQVVDRLVKETSLPLVLDADALNAYEGRADELRLAVAGRGAEVVLTPHPGELGRLLGMDSGAIAADPVGAARQAADQLGAITVLKGHPSLVADPRGGIAVCPVGNPGMATGGSGDVLTGMIGALLGQGYDPLSACHLAVFAHGSAGDLAANALGEMGLAAGDVLDRLPDVWRRWEGA